MTILLQYRRVFSSTAHGLLVDISISAVIQNLTAVRIYNRTKNMLK